MLEHKSTRDWDHLVNVYVPGASEPVATCRVSELREVTAGLGRGWSTRTVPASPDLLQLLGWREVTPAPAVWYEVDGHRIFGVPGAGA